MTELEGGRGLLSWEPDEGHPDFHGYSMTPGDPGYPEGISDPDELLRWGVERWRS